MCQLEEGVKALAQATQLLARCPSCYENFRRSICEFTCGTTISDYLDPTVINGENSKSVNSCRCEKN